MEACKPILLNGIDVLVTRPDLLDRTVSMTLGRLQSRVVESQMVLEFNRYLPKILGGLMDLFAKSLAVIEHVKIDKTQLPRLGDFAVLGESVYRTMGLPQGNFLDEFNEMRSHASQRILEGQPLGIILPDFVDQQAGSSFEGTMKSLLKKLVAFAPSHLKLPQTPRALGDKLRRLTPAFMGGGINVVLDPVRKRDAFHVCIKKFDLTQKESSQPFQNKDSLSECEHGEHCEGVSKTIIAPAGSHVFQGQI